MKPEPFWITNYSPRGVTLADLGLHIPAYHTINLMDTRHYNFTIEQLMASKTSGSLFKKSDKVAVREIPPSSMKNKKPAIANSSIANRARSVFVINQKEYDELKLDEDKELEKRFDEELAREGIEEDDNNTTTKGQ